MLTTENYRSSVFYEHGGHSSDSLSCLEALSGDEEHRELPGVSHEKTTFALLVRDACCPDLLAYGLDLLRVVKHDRPMAQTHPTLLGRQHVLPAPYIEAERMMVAAGDHERRGAGNERYELEPEHVAVEARLSTKNALLNMIDHLQTRGFTRQQAYALCSVAVDLRISQTVDVPNLLVSALLPLDIFV
jgi:hypothetical protein